MSNPVISTLISKRHVIWWVRSILQYSRPLPSNWSTCFLRLSQHSFLPIFFVLAFEGLATPGQPCGQVSRADPWQKRKTNNRRSHIPFMRVMPWLHACPPPGILCVVLWMRWAPEHVNESWWTLGLLAQRWGKVWVGPYERVACNVRSCTWTCTPTLGDADLPS